MADSDSDTDGGPDSDSEPHPQGRLLLGDPWALAGDCELLEDPGSWAAVRCDDCGTVFKLALLTAGPKRCPGGGCAAVYTSALLVARADDDEIFADACAHVVEANGYELRRLDRSDFDGEGDEDDPDETEDGEADAEQDRGDK